MKLMVWNAVKSRKALKVVTNAQTFYEEAVKLSTSITVSFVSKKEIYEMADVLCLQKMLQ